VMVGATAPVFGIAAVSTLTWAIITPGLNMMPILGSLAVKEYIHEERVIAKLPDRHRKIVVRAKHLPHVELSARGDGSTSLGVPHDGGWARFDDARAIQNTAVLLAGVNRNGAGGRSVDAAVNQIEAVGDAMTFMAAASARSALREATKLSPLHAYRQLGVMHLSPAECLALEMAVHEESERRAMHGELAALEQAWRDAEEIARICDDDLTPPKLYE
jgi:hypothetical protein